MTDKPNDIIDEEEEEVETIVFEDMDGNEHEFVDIGDFEYEGKEYLALAPYEMMTCEHDEDEECDCDEGGILYCEIVSGDKDDEEELVPVEDDDLNDKLHATFTAIMEAELKNMADDGVEPEDKE